MEQIVAKFTLATLEEHIKKQGGNKKPVAKL
jgi:hypothetical protein